VCGSNVCFIILKLETALVLSGVFNLPGKKQLHDHNYAGKVIVIDANETLIERLKKSQQRIYSGKKGLDTLKSQPVCIFE
jgi:hypothetical protein